MMRYVREMMLIMAVGLGLMGCRPAGPPPDVLKAQKEALEKARALEGQMQQQLQDRMKTVDEPQK